MSLYEWYDSEPDAGSEQSCGGDYLTPMCLAASSGTHFWMLDETPNGVDGVTGVGLASAASRAQSLDFRLGDGTVSAGVDTLYLGAEFELSRKVAAILSGMKERARSGEVVKVRSGPFHFRVQPFGLKPHYAWVLEGPAMSVKIRSRDGYGVNAELQFRSSFLHGCGPALAVELGREFIERISRQSALSVIRSPSKPARLWVRRIDLYKDTEGAGLDGTELAGRQFVTRARRRATVTFSARARRRWADAACR